MSKTKKPKQTGFTPVDIAPIDLISVLPGHFGFHAVIQGRHGMWSTSKVSPEHAVALCVARYLMPDLMQAAVSQGKALHVDIRPEAPMLFSILVGITTLPA